jgi:AbrB family looped-hinge helix DNA binding protein
MSSATITSKGQITIPADVRERLKVGAGDRLEFVEVAPGRFEVIPASRSIRELKGLFGPARRSVSIDEMNRVIARRGSGKPK